MKACNSLLKPAVACCLLLLAATLKPAPVSGQDSNGLPTLDSLPSLFLSGLSPVILNKDQVEVNNYNPLTSFWLAIKEAPPELAGGVVTNRYRLTYFENFVRVSYGFAYNRRWDLGAEFRFTNYRLDDIAQNSPFKVFGSDEEFAKTYRGLTMVGARARYMPLRRVPELTLQGALTFPVASEEIRHAVGLDRVQFDLGGTYYHNLNPKLYYFLQSNWLMRFSNNNNEYATHQLQASGFLVRSFFYQKLYVYPGLTYAGLFQRLGSRGFGQANYQVLGGLGVQYQPLPILSVSLLGQLPFILESGSETTEWVRESYSSWTLGLLVRLN